MLGKLIKYDLKYMNRFLILIHAFLLGASLLIRFFLTGHILSADFQPEASHSLLLICMTVLLCVLLLTGVYFSTYLIILARFYKNLFSDQGYLTHTLPVTTGRHLLSKIISGTIWGCANTLLILLSIYIIVWTPSVNELFQTQKPDILTGIGFTGAYADISFGTFIFYLIVLILVSVILNLATFYTSIVVGQFFHGHPILGAVAVYFILNTVLSIFSLFILVVTGILIADTSQMESFNSIDHFMRTSNASALLSVILSAILFLASYWIMRKKVDLD